MGLPEICKQFAEAQRRTERLHSAFRRLAALLMIFVILAALAVILLVATAKGEVSSSPSYPVTQSPSHHGLWRVTAYCPCRVCCGPRACGVTASGRPAAGKLFAAPPEVPFGTRLYVPGYGWATCADRGGAIQGRRLDVLMPTHQAAKDWGVKWINLKKGKGSWLILKFALRGQ